MSGQLRPWRPEDFEDSCETCGAPPGQLCRSWCDTGYTSEDARRDAELRDQDTKSPAPTMPTSHPKE
ncbi:hypothetical protein [Streptomyces griseorubiginosus]|uniref:hypothetical protein n=1 Tax=Streptomyces griseorubiginosus TaxID=67304 RepID=UPI0033EADAD0